MTANTVATRKAQNLLTRIITDRVRSTRESYLLTRVCPSIHLSVHTWGGGGVPQPGADGEGGTQPGLGGGYPTSGTLTVGPGQGGTPAGGTPPWVPPWTWQGVPLLGGIPPRVAPTPSDLGGTPPVGPGKGGTPPQVTPPCQTWQGGIPARGTPPWLRDGVLDTLQSVCLLRSCRTFLFV